MKFSSLDIRSRDKQHKRLENVERKLSCNSNSRSGVQAYSHKAVGGLDRRRRKGYRYTDKTKNNQSARQFLRSHSSDLTSHSLWKSHISICLWWMKRLEHNSVTLSNRTMEQVELPAAKRSSAKKHTAGSKRHSWCYSTRACWCKQDSVFSAR